jgi:hypothetical protein
MDYFKHDINASDDDKICDLLADGGYELLGYYWRFIEYLYGRGGKVSKNRLNGVAWSLHMDADKLSQVICNYGLFCEDDEYIYSERVVKEMGEFEAVGKRMAEIGRSGGQASAQARAKHTVKQNEACGQAEVKHTVKRAVEECLTEGEACGQQKKREEKKIKKNKIEESVREAHISPLGAFENVFLTDDEIVQLKSQHPTAYASKIERLSEYMHQSGKQYKDHFSLIKKWIEEDGDATSSFDTDDFFEAAVKKALGENF